MGKRVSAMENDEAVEEVVVIANGVRHGSPVLGVHRRGVEQRVELDDAVADMALIGGGRRPEGRNRDGLAIEDSWDLQRRVAGHVVERGPRRHGAVHETLAGLKAIRAMLHTDGASGADDEDAGLWEASIRLASGRWCHVAVVTLMGYS